MTRNRLAIAGFALPILLGGCVSIPSGDLPAGRFTGEVFVMWVGEGNSTGDGRFLFVPNPKQPLTFYRQDPAAPGAVVKPSMMYTDGGSIPRIATLFKGLSPWGYAPAYMVHDWLFTARHCLVDGETDQKYLRVKDVTFEDSARILGEAIEGLMAAKQVDPNDLAVTVITAAVDSSVARNLWDAKGACADLQVTPAHKAAADAAIPGSSQAIRRAGVPKAVLVGQVKF